MNVLFMSLLYPNDQLAEISTKAKDKLQNQINNYQRAFEAGIRENLAPDEKLDILNCLPVGIYPMQYRDLILQSGMHDENSIRQLGCINLPWFKQQMRARSAARQLKKWIQSNPENRTVLVYTQYLPYMKAISRVKKLYPEIKAAVIVTDLPNDLGLATGRKGLMKWFESHMGNQSLSLCREMDGFILLTQPMAEAIGISDKPYEVIEGLILKNTDFDSSVTEQNEKPVILYTGTLERGLGIAEMLDAFGHMPDYELWICGHGNMAQEVQSAAEKNENIHYYGFVPQKEALALQARADALINPRQPSGVFTKYSFPSKTLEYMRSGKPVLCCKLEGIPDDYSPYLNYIPSNGSAGIQEAVSSLMKLPAEKRKEMGESARDYVNQQKNPKIQCQKLVSLLRRL